MLFVNGKVILFLLQLLFFSDVIRRSNKNKKHQVIIPACPSARLKPRWAKNIFHSTFFLMTCVLHSDIHLFIKLDDKKLELNYFYPATFEFYKSWNVLARHRHQKWFHRTCWAWLDRKGQELPFWRRERFVLLAKRECFGQDSQNIQLLESIGLGN